MRSNNARSSRLKTRVTEQNEIKLNLKQRGLNPLLNERELAAYRGVTVSKVRDERMNSCGPPYIKDGHQVRYRLSDVDDWLEERKHGAR